MDEQTIRYLVSRNQYTLKEVTQLVIDQNGHLFGVGCKASSEFAIFIIMFNIAWCVKFEGLMLLVKS